MPSPTSKAWVARVIPWVRSFATARAPGGKARRDSLSVHRTPGRLVAFSDAVFAIAIAVLVLEIRITTDPRNLGHGLAALLAALDIHPRVAMQILRHSKIAVTMEIYTEVPLAATRDALRRLGQWLRS